MILNVEALCHGHNCAACVSYIIAKPVLNSDMQDLLYSSLVCYHYLIQKVIWLTSELISSS